MKKITWFTHTNIACKESKELHFDLTPMINIFIQNELWKKKKYRTEYYTTFEKEDLEKIKSVRIFIYTDIAPFSNFHSYEDILQKHIDLSKIEKVKLFSSGISDASKIAVIEVEFESQNDVIKNLTYNEEKKPEVVFGKLLTEKNMDTLEELQKIKSIICEFLQFFIFNLHLNFLTHSYTFSIKDKPELIGFTTVSESQNIYYETDKIEFLAHYILYNKEIDNLEQLMNQTSKFWCKDIPSIHFFLDSLKGIYITSTNFIKLVFSLESFFGENISNDYISLVVPLVISKNVNEMKKHRELIRKCFSLRNEIVHGSSVINFREHSLRQNESKRNIDDLYFELKNLIIYIFYFFLNRNLYLNEHTRKINHELIFSLIPTGLNSEKSGYNH